MSYSDLPYSDVMKKASIANASGSDFWLVAPERTMLKSAKPVIAICAVRTGSGKSQTARYVSKLLRDMGVKVVIIRHPMPYGILKDQKVERFSSMKDLDKYKTTIEEREDYEPHIRNRFILYAGVDYEEILRAAEKEADILIWDGGNNDAPFIKPNLFITVADPLRAGNELTYYPGVTVARMANAIIINKVNSATVQELRLLENNIRQINKNAKIIYADSVVTPDNPKLDVELPAMGYSVKQIRDLQTTINNADCDIVVSATPTNLRNIININKPIVQVNYELKPRSNMFDKMIKEFVADVKK